MQSLVKVPQTILWAFLIFSIVLIIILILYYAFLSRDKNASIISLLIVWGFCLVVLILGVLRVQIAEFYITNDKLSKLNGKGIVAFEGFVSAEPDVRNTTQNIKIKLGKDNVLVTTEKYPEYHYLDKLRITGKLEEPAETEEFSYKKYLLKDHIYSVMGFPKIQVIGKVNPTVLQKFYSSILDLKQKIRENIQKNYSPPGSLIMQGMILGDKAAIPKDLKNKFSVTGTSHIIAVSGTHLVILGALLLKFLTIIGLSRSKSFYASVIFICFYILLVGAPSSGIRSAIMAIIFMLGQKLGRQNASLRMIFFAGALMLLQNPLLLTLDVGFQLSFLAVLGLILFEPLVKRFFNFRLRRIKKNFSFGEAREDGLVSMVSTTLSAQIFTLPIIVFNFGNISWVYPITNILILPVIYCLMLFGFMSVVAGLFWGALSWILSLPCTFILWYFMWVVDLFSQPWMSKVINDVHWIWLVFYYLAVAIILRIIRKKIIHSILPS